MPANDTHLSFQSYSSESRVHIHDFHQIVMPIQGTLALRVGNNESDIANDNLAIIAAGQEHAFSAQNDNRFVVANIPFKMLPQLEVLPTFSKLDKALCHYLSFVKQYVDKGGNNHQSVIELFVTLLEEKYSDTIKQDKRIVLVKRFMDSNFTQPIAINELAQVGHLSVRQLNELFRNIYGQSPKQYLITKRMNRAKQLLLHSSCSVSNVAEQVGYTSLASFSERFKQHFSYSPRDFRQKEQK